MRGTGRCRDLGAFRRRSLLLLACVVICALALGAAGSASANWNQPVVAALNVDPAQGAFSSGMTNVGGVPYVAWQEIDGSGNQQIRVKRFDGSAWVTVGSGSLNVSTSQNGIGPVIADVGGIPYVTWHESAGSIYKIRVKRFDGSTWVPVGSGPLNV
jgi:hypothetical protein